MDITKNKTDIIKNNSDWLCFILIFTEMYYVLSFIITEPIIFIDWLNKEEMFVLIVILMLIQFIGTSIQETITYNKQHKYE